MNVGVGLDRHTKEVIKIANKKRKKRKISKKAMIIAVIICLLAIVIMLIDTFKKVEVQLPEKEKAELTSNKNKTEKDILKEYKIEEKSKIYNEENKLEIEVKFFKNLYDNDESNKEYFEAIIKEFVKINKTDFILIDKEKNIRIEIFATSENNYQYTINNIENYFNITEEKNDKIKEFKEIESKDVDIKNVELNKFDNNEWSVNSAGVKILEYGEDYLGYENYKILTDDIYIDTIILESTYEEEVLEGIKVGTSKEEIKEKLGEPTFGDNGYKINDSYMFFYDDEVAIYPNAIFKNVTVEELIINHINSEEKEERKFLAFRILQANFDFKSYIDDNNILNVMSPNRGIALKIDTNNQVTVNLYNNYDFTSKTKDYIREGIFNLESETDLIFETEKNRK